MLHDKLCVFVTELSPVTFSVFRLHVDTFAESESVMGK